MAMRKPASGGPMNWLLTISTPHRRLLAVCSCDRATMAGMKVWAVLSLSTSAKPVSKEVA